MVTWSTSTPRSARSSSTSRYASPKRRYHRTASRITSGGNRNPANDLETGRGDARRRFTVPPSPTRARSANATDPGNKGARTAGVDGIAPRSVVAGVGSVLVGLGEDLKAAGSFP